MQPGHERESLGATPLPAHNAFLCLGSNHAAAAEILASAALRLGALPGCELVASSSVYLTEPQDYLAQPWFHNQVIQLGIDSGISPGQLMESALAIEKELGRTRNGIRFGPRPIDIDILLIDDIVSDNPVCILPHPRLERRAFALVPLIELAPEIEILGRSAKSWLAELDWHLDSNKIFQ